MVNKVHLNDISYSITYSGSIQVWPEWRAESVCISYTAVLSQLSLVIVVGLSVLQGEGQPNQTEILDVLLTYRRGEEGGEREK